MNDDKLKSLEDKLKCLEETNSKYQKLKQLMATKVFWSDTSNENLETLLKLDIEKLFEKYEQIMKIKAENVEFKEATETLNDVKTKLKLQIEQRDLYEKQFCEIMDFLNIPIGNRSFENIMPAIRDLKDALELSEIDNYANAESVLRLNS